ncbi:MAG TPA: Hint domain-containing protein [Acetobacteraceae bacterium]|nr:Hint domain-containing protein [Acetobacteraceae bacterium]
MPDTENRSVGLQRSRRNFIKIGTGAASALAYAMKAGPASAGHACVVGCSCFLRGTTIRAADGDKKVEDLIVGDLLPTVFGGVRPIQWIARYHFTRPDSTKAWVRDVLPVRVARSALGPGVPHSNLFITRPHSLLIDDVLVPVGNLINGTTIVLSDARELGELELFHIKLESHDVIFAEGVPCETLLSVDENAMNFIEYLGKYGQSTSNDAPCAPVLGFGLRVEINSRLRSAISPWFDRRQKLDIIRDKLEEGESILERQAELIC